MSKGYLLLFSVLVVDHPQLLFIYELTLIPCRFPSSTKASKPGRVETTPAKGTLTSMMQSEVDLVCL